MVKVIKSTDELILLRASERRSVGFVPTMGNLHAGHISLLQEALTSSELVYFSIFVNPKQFGPSEDFSRYPRTLEDDIRLIQECLTKFPGKDIVVYAPQDPKEVFPPVFNTAFSVQGLSTDLEGELRPGHFDGVATVVWRLFDLVKPAKAWFGLKDYQQYLVIRQMVRDLALPIEIIGMPIVRESSGLALSSRNQYLSREEKDRSLILFHTLTEMRDLLAGKKEKLPELKTYIQKKLQDKNWNYLELRDAETFSKDLSQSKKVTILAVYQLGTTRLLDNTQMEIA